MAIKKVIPLSKKVDKTILGALALAQRFPGLRLIFKRMSSAFTSGRLSKIGDIPKVEQKTQYLNHQFTVKKLDGNRIGKVHVLIEKIVDKKNDTEES